MVIIEHDRAGKKYEGVLKGQGEYEYLSLEALYAEKVKDAEIAYKVDQRRKESSENFQKQICKYEQRYSNYKKRTYYDKSMLSIDKNVNVPIKGKNKSSEFVMKKAHYLSSDRKTIVHTKIIYDKTNLNIKNGKVGSARESFRQLLKQLEVGDSVYFDIKDAEYDHINSLRSVAEEFNYKLTSRTIYQEEDSHEIVGHRVWRAE